MYINCEIAIKIAQEKNQHQGLLHVVDEMLLEEHISECTACQQKLCAITDKYQD